MIFFRNLVLIITKILHQKRLIVDLRHLEKNVDESHQVNHHPNEIINDIRYYWFFSIKNVHNSYSFFPFFCLALFSSLFHCSCSVSVRFDCKKKYKQDVHVLLTVTDNFSLFYFHFARVYHCCLCLYCVSCLLTSETTNKKTMFCFMDFILSIFKHLKVCTTSCCLSHCFENKALKSFWVFSQTRPFFFWAADVTGIRQHAMSTSNSTASDRNYVNAVGFFEARSTQTVTSLVFLLVFRFLLPCFLVFACLLFIYCQPQQLFS